MPFQKEKQCNKCKEVKPQEDFNWRNIYKGWLKSICKKCESIRFSAYYERNRLKLCKRSRDYYKTWKDLRFEQVLAVLGRVCKCCGEANPGFLTVDHIHNDGWKDGHSRSGRALWSKIRKEGYPKSRYQILCFNCNCGRARQRDKVCPHKKEG